MFALGGHFFECGVESFVAFFVCSYGFECFFGAEFDALGCAAAEVACYCKACVGVNCNSAVWAGLYAPIAAFAFLVADLEDSAVFALADGFFWAGCYALGVFAASTG